MSISCEFGKDNRYNFSDHSGDEGESLSLCDLPLEGEDRNQREIQIENGEHDRSEEKTAKASGKSKSRASEDFDFGSLAASLDALESEMCAADEIFFRGQILPFRHSISSATVPNLPRAVSRSESMDRNAGSGFRSSSTASSSRSSSTRSSSINSSASAGQMKIRNQFHSFPSPKPYAHASNAPRSSFSSASSANKRSSALWEIFRLSLVRTPEIELEDLKIRCSKHQSSGGGRSEGAAISRNSSSGESSNGAGDNGKCLNKGSRRRNGGGMSLMLSSMSCKSSTEAVAPEKVGKGTVEEKQRKQDVRHRRTFEWLKQLSQSQPGVLNDAST